MCTIRDEGPAEKQEQLVDSQQIQGKYRRADDGELNALERRATKVPDCLRHHRQHHRFDAEKHPFTLGGGSELHIQPREKEGDKGCRQNEGGTRREQSLAASTFLADVHHHFCAVRAGNQVGDTEQIEEPLLAQPRALLHHILPQHGNVRGRAAECRDPQF